MEPSNLMEIVQVHVISHTCDSISIKGLVPQHVSVVLHIGSLVYAAHCYIYSLKLTTNLETYMFGNLYVTFCPNAMELLRLSLIWIY